jgi:hypothetical protein
VTILSELQTKWILLHDELGESFGDQILAAPFFTVAEGASAGAQKRPILMVGKATDGDWGGNDFARARAKPISERLVERLKFTSDQLRGRMEFDRKPSAFWRFQNGLEQISKSVIWTDLAKIGVQQRNPKWRLVRKQSELARRTLAAEIDAYRPSLIVLVTGDFGRHEIIWPMFGRNEAWRDDMSASFLWQVRSRFQIPVLWTKHPGFKSSAKLQLWLRMARELYETMIQPTQT